MTLCVIDMQPKFRSSRLVLEPVKLEVLKAIKRREPIVVMEYVEYGNTHKELISILRGYDKQTIVSKDNDNGTAELITTLKAHRFNTSRLRFCGVNTCYCVWDTMWGVREYFDGSKFELLTDSINCTCGKRHCIERFEAEKDNCLKLKRHT